MNFRRLRWVLLASFFALSLMPLMVFIFDSRIETETLVRKNAQSHLESVADKSVLLVENFQSERLSDLRVVSRMIQPGMLQDGARLQGMLKMMEEQYRVYLEFRISGLEGGMIFSTAVKPGEIPQVFQGLEHSLEGREFVSDVFLYPPGETPAVLICLPLAEPSGKPWASLGAVVDFRPIEHLLRRTSIGRTGEVFLVDREGLFLMSTRLGARLMKDKISAFDSGEGAAGLTERVDYRGKRVYSARRPLTDRGWFVIAEQDKDEAMEEIAQINTKMTVIVSVSIAFLAVAMIILTGITARGLEKIYKHEKELEFQVNQREKLASLGLMTAGIAHELNTPLANALLYTQMAMRELPASEEGRREKLATVEQEIKQGSMIVRNLLALSRYSEIKSSESDVNEILLRLLALSEPLFKARKVEINRDLSGGALRTPSEVSALQQVFTNLIANALDAMPKGGVLTVRTRRVESLRRINVEISDTGSGIPPEILGKVFDPFFTTKGDGVGLGLFVSYEIVRKLGGNIRVISRAAGQGAASGTLFTVELPAAGSPGANGSAR